MAKRKMKVSKMEEKCCSPAEHGPMCMGFSVLILGVLILLNALYGWLTWGVFVGIIVILKGLITLLHPKTCK